MKSMIAVAALGVGLSISSVAWGDLYYERTETSRTSNGNVNRVDAVSTTTTSTSRTIIDPSTRVVVPMNEEQIRQDTLLTQQAQDVIHRNDSLSMAARTIDIKAESGVVTLSGNVNSPDEREFIEGTIFRVPGVIRVESNLNVLNR
jgi:osmotically-inducible protein OsmY